MWYIVGFFLVLATVSGDTDKNCTVVSVDQYDFSTIYKILPEQTSLDYTRVKFYVKARADALIMLRADPDSHDDPNNARTDRVLTAAIGFSSNGATGVRTGTATGMDYNETYVTTPNILSEYEYRGFWIDVFYHNRYVNIGLQCQSVPFMTVPLQASDLPSNTFTHFSIASWASSEANWKMNCL